MVALPSSDERICVMYGGYVSTWRDGCVRSDGCWSYNLHDMLTLDTQTYLWTKLELNGPEPLPRGAHSCCVLGSFRLLFFGGGILYFDGIDHKEEDCDQLFSVDTRTWTVQCFEAKPSQTGDAPAARGSHSSAVVAFAGTLGILMLGGRDYNRDGTIERDIHRGRSDSWLLACDVGLLDAAPIMGEDRDAAAPAGS
mmetsp:Transcript_23940/g.60550  ORF Transcript_23940/g.60550 Transcript_23940/m.60550 type:complete len:196 (-) Transcript_23940:175-762(-)